MNRIELPESFLQLSPQRHQILTVADDEWIYSDVGWITGSGGAGYVNRAMQAAAKNYGTVPARRKKRAWLNAQDGGVLADIRVEQTQLGNIVRDLRQNCYQKIFGLEVHKL